MYYNIHKSPLGDIIMLSNGTHITGLYFDKQHKLQTNATLKDIEVFKDAKNWLRLYFARQIPTFTPPLFLQGSVFAMLVWDILKHIQYGKTTSYQHIAHIIASKRQIPKMSAQAVGGAIGKNPIAIMIPCHRVIGANNQLVGYAYGIDIKAKLLAIEGNDIGSFKP